MGVPDHMRDDAIGTILATNGLYAFHTDELRRLRREHQVLDEDREIRARARHSRARCILP